MKNEEIPQTDSIQEMARFWDSHDLTDFEDHLEEVSDTVFEHDTVTKIHLQRDEVEAVRKLAAIRGISYSDLLRKWILERIHAV
ncbi:MAG: CopG family antitoxin [Thermodesulfobacteriota bacterium]|nr:CopG family antitoxin [Thermodesulfobacteriota bacterium]